MNRCLSFLTVAGLGLAVLPQAAVAQRQQQQNLERVLFLPPTPADQADSSYVIELASEVRSRLGGRVRNQVTVITTDQYCEALTASGFACTFLPDANSSGQLAQFLRADSYAMGSFERNSAVPSVRLRLVDIGRSGISGWLTARGEAGQSARDFARVISDSLRNQVRAGLEARSCGERRDRSDFRGARERANRVFVLYPNHPSAAQCVAYVFEATQQPADSVIWAYRKAVEGDPALERTWERLGRLYLTNGDTTEAIEAFDSQFQVDPTNAELRLQVARMWVDQENYDRALELADEGLQLNPGDIELLQLRARTCFDGAMWSCAVAALSAQYEIREELAQDSLFFVQVMGASELANDTAAVLRWTDEAVNQFPNSRSFWGRRASWLKGTGDTAAALVAFERITQLAPDDHRALLAYASELNDRIVIDTATPLDTMTLMAVDSLLTLVADKAGDDQNVQRSIAVFYFTPASLLARAQIRPDIAMAWLEKSMQHDVTGQLTTQASFFYGLASFFYLRGQFEPVRDSQSCELSREFDGVAKLGVQRMTAGASVHEGTAQQLMPALGQMSDAGGQFVEAYCSQN